MRYACSQKRTHLKAPHSPLTALSPAGRGSKTMPQNVPLCPRMPRLFSVWQKEPKPNVARVSNPCERRGIVRTGWKPVPRQASLAFGNVQQCSGMFSFVQRARKAQNEPTATRIECILHGHQRLEAFPRSVRVTKQDKCVTTLAARLRERFPTAKNQTL